MPQRAVRIFISHSANAAEEPATQVFLQNLHNALSAVEGFEPLTDQRDLQAGDAWMQKLYTWMGLCDAAVILLSPRAVTRENSAWVPRETNLLLWRKALDETFVVVPVMIGGIVAADLAANPFLADVRLRDVQFADGLSDADKIPVIVDALKEKLAARRARLVFDPVRVNLEDALQRYAPQASIDNALVAHFAADVWQPLVAPAQKLALKLLQRAGDDHVDPVIQDVASGSQGEYRLGSRLFETLYPMRLPAESACRLMGLCLEQEGQGLVLVNANDSWAIKALLRAATGLPRDELLRKWHVVEMRTDWSDKEFTEVRDLLAEQLAEGLMGTGAWETLSFEEDPGLRLQEQLSAVKTALEEAREDRAAPVLLCARYRREWLKLVPQVLGFFPTTVFLFWTGDTIPELAPDIPRHAVLAPAWSPGQDRKWRLRYSLKLTQFGGSA